MLSPPISDEQSPWICGRTIHCCLHLVSSQLAFHCQFVIIRAFFFISLAKVLQVFLPNKNIYDVFVHVQWSNAANPIPTLFGLKIKWYMLLLTEKHDKIKANLTFFLTSPTLFLFFSNPYQQWIKTSRSLYLTPVRLSYSFRGTHGLHLMRGLSSS